MLASSGSHGPDLLSGYLKYGRVMIWREIDDPRHGKASGFNDGADGLG